MYARRQINTQNDGILAHGSTIAEISIFFVFLNIPWLWLWCWLWIWLWLLSWF
jgi:hypothetical protein